MPDIYSLTIQPPHKLSTIDNVAYALLSPIRQYLTKIEWLDWQENVVGDYTADVLDGSINIDASKDSRRSFSLTANNANSLYIPNSARTNMGVKLRVKRGIQTAAGPVWWNRGVFVLTDPTAVHRVAEKTVDINGVDKWALLDGSLGGTLTETTIIDKGSNIADAIRAVAEIAGEFKFAFDVCTEVTPYTVTKEPGDTMADLIKELALIPSWDICYDVNGYLRFTPLVDPLQKQVVADLSVGGTYRKLYVSSEYSPEWSKIKNYWKVIGYSDPDTGIIYDGTAQDNNPASPTNTATPPNGIGIKAEVLTDDNLATDSLCSQRAAYELRKNLTRIDRSSHEVIPLPFLNEGDCIQLEDPATGITDDKYEIQSINEPFGLGLMQIQCWRCSMVFEIVAHDDFQNGLGTWKALQGGEIDIVGFEGNNCLRKKTNNDPNGGYRLLGKPVTDFELVVYTRRDNAGTGSIAYSVVDSDGNGYSVAFSHGTKRLSLFKRTAWSASAISNCIGSGSFDYGEWYTLRLIKIGGNFTAEIHKGKTLEFATPLIVVNGADISFASFDRVSVNGGYVYYTDDVTVRKLL